MIDENWIAKAVNIIKSGMVQKLERDGVTVYSCGKIIRIDIKDGVEITSDTRDKRLAQFLESRYAYYELDDTITIRQLVDDIKTFLQENGAEAK